MYDIYNSTNLVQAPRKSETNGNEVLKTVVKENPDE